MEENKSRYLHAYDRCKDNFDSGTITSLFQNLLYMDKNEIFDYLKKIKETYNQQNYMYVLEKFNNYLVVLFKMTYKDYCENDNDYMSKETLNNISRKNHIILNAYNQESQHLENRKQEFSKISKFKRKTVKERYYV